MWELPDRLELCVMQVISENPNDIVAASLPTLYFWSASHAEFSDGECAEIVSAVRRAAELLWRINGG